jgi:hypothetical protein
VGGRDALPRLGWVLKGVSRNAMDYLFVCPRSATISTTNPVSASLQ